MALLARSVIGAVRWHRRIINVVLPFVLILGTVIGAGYFAAQPASAVAATRLPSTPQVGVQDGWINRGHAQAGTLDEGCSSNDENELAKTTPAPLYGDTAADTAAIPAAVDDGANWTDLNVHYLRVAVPWDVAYHHDHLVRVTEKRKTGKTQTYRVDPNQILELDQKCLDYWLADVNRANIERALRHLPLIEPQVQFRPDPNHLGTGRNADHVMVPSIGTYRTAMQSFTDIYSCGTSGSPSATCTLPAVIPTPPGGTRQMTRVSTITPWGEPDFNSDKGDRNKLTGAINGQYFMPQGTRRFGDANCTQGVNTCGPVLAAQMWVAVDHRCHNCTVIAGTFGSSQHKDDQYLPVYAHNLGGLHPRVWAIDDYTDIDLKFEHPCLINKEKSCLAPDPTGTLLWDFSKQLASLHYGSDTRVWLGEISVFETDTITFPGEHYGPGIQRQAADYLLKDLAKPGAYTKPGWPSVQRLYYMRYEDGSGYPDFALVLDDPAHHTETRAPAYAAFRLRSHPQR